eukprot:7835005-Pyramimonas_sp.AAC.2
MANLLDKLKPVSSSQTTHLPTWDRSGSGAALAEAQQSGLKWWERLKANKGRGGALGVGCGAGIGLGLIGSLGLGIGGSLRPAFGIGAGCGVGVGYGWGAGVGKRWDGQYISPEAARKELKKLKKGKKRCGLRTRARTFRSEVITHAMVVHGLVRTLVVKLGFVTAIDCWCLLHPSV